MRRRQFFLGAAGTVAGVMAAKLAKAVTPCPPPVLQISGGASATTACEAASDGAKPAWLQGKSKFQWVSLQSPSAANVAPNPLPPGNSGVSSVTDAWCGAAFRKKGSWLLLHGGGHQDYAGNEIYGLSLEQDSPTWQRLRDPTPNDKITTNTYYYADGNPAAIHTYGRLVYDDQRDILMRFGNGQYPVGGVGPGVDGWAWGNANWLPAGTFQAHPSSGMTFYEGMGYTKDPATGDVYGVNAIVRYIWRHATQKFDAPIKMSADAGENSMTFDTKRGYVWSVQPKTPGAILRWDVKGSGGETVLPLKGSAAGDIKDSYMGIAYDPVADTIFIYRQSGTLYAVNPSTMEISVVPTNAGVSGAAVTPTATSGSNLGINNRFQYVPNLGGCVVLARWSAPTLFILTH